MTPARCPSTSLRTSRRYQMRSVGYARRLFPNLNDLITSGQCCFDAGPKTVENGQQVLRAAVPQTDPNEPPAGLYTSREMNEILVLGDEDFLRLTRATPDFEVRQLSQADLGDMLALRASSSKKPAQGNRELVINQESH
jgi:hypothetical protein